ncbi:MAG: DUF3718 domain-containing protein [Burkholderiales bacterium]|nr:DUF3718 domain-containing protein [Burkholderiales bacterium]
MGYRAASVLIALGIMGSAMADEVTTSICEYTKLNDRSSLRQKLEDANLDLRTTYDDIRCGDKSPLRVAAESGATDSATFIISKVGKRAITAQDHDGMSALQWAQKRMDSADASSKAKIASVVNLMQSKL